MDVEAIGDGAGTARAPRATATVTLPAAPTAPRAARAFLTGELAGRVDEDTLDQALLLTTELVTNVVLHAGTSAVVTVAPDTTGVTVRVADGNPSPLTSRPGRADASGLREDGRGLTLVNAIAAAWGTEHTRSGKTVWFRLEPDIPAPDIPGPAPDSSGPDGLDDHVTRGARPRPAPLPARSPRLLAADLAAAVSAADELGELAWHLLDAHPHLDGAQVHRFPSGATVATAGIPRARSEARSVPLVAGGSTVGRLSLWPGDAELDAEGMARVTLASRWMALILREADARRAEERRIGMLAFLAEASDLLSGNLDTAKGVALLARLPVPRLADWCTVHLLDQAGNPSLAAAAHTDETRVAALSRHAGEPAGEIGRRVRAALGGARVTLHEGDAGPVAVVVLKARHRLLGALTLGRDKGPVFETDEVTLLVDLARRASFAVDNARLFGQQVEVADALAAGLLPPDLPRIPGLDLGAVYRAARAGLDVGGDFFDLVETEAEPEPSAGPGGGPGRDAGVAPPGTWTISVGDVCGKGAEAAAVTGIARAVLRLLANRGRPVDDSLRVLNRALYSAGDPAGARGRFCTVAVARVAPAQARRRPVSLRLAGHPQPVRLTAGGDASLVGTPGTLLGVLDDAQVDFPETQVDLSPGDALVLYTDGVVEGAGPSRMLGEDGLLAAARQCAGMSAQGIADRLRSAAERSAGGAPRDDLAIVVLRVPTVTDTDRGRSRPTSGR